MMYLTRDKSRDRIYPKKKPCTGDSSTTPTMKRPIQCVVTNSHINTQNNDIEVALRTCAISLAMSSEEPTAERRLLQKNVVHQQRRRNANVDPTKRPPRNPQDHPHPARREPRQHRRASVLHHGRLAHPPDRAGEGAGSLGREAGGDPPWLQFGRRD